MCGSILAQTKPEASKTEIPKQDASRRVELNILGVTDAASGESRRNENIQFNLVDNNALKELNVRLGTTATIIREFEAARNYFGAEFGVAPAGAPHTPASSRSGFHGNLHANHQNSVFSARSYFQVGAVQPAHENDYGFSAGLRLWRGAHGFFEGSQQKLRGQVNGNVLVPKPDERTPLTADPEDRPIVERFLAAYPKALPNRTDINPRALNTNSPQVIDNDNAGARLDQAAGPRDRLALDYRFTSQQVEAFQLVAGQNPNTDTKNHRARLTWNRQWSAATVSDLSAGFDRIGSLLVPERNAVGPMVSAAGLTTLGPQGNIPINRALNLFRYAGQLRQARGAHLWTAGFGILRRQLNGVETDAHRGFFSFANDFGNDGITNLLLGRSSNYLISIGDVHRGFRNWDLQFYAGDRWNLRPGFTLHFGLRYTPFTTPSEVDNRNTVPYDCDCNNLAPQFGLAWRAPRRSGTLRAAYGLHFGEIFPVTFQQVRFDPPGSVKVTVYAPKLSRPLSGGAGPDQPGARGNRYLLDPALAAPYSHQYNFSWEPEFSREWRLQLGYAGSRSHKLLLMWYLNRAHYVPGIDQTTETVNQRRADPRWAEIRYVVNGSRGYFDAARATLVVPGRRNLSVDFSYWFSKAMDLGSSYTNTACDADSRLSRSQSEFGSQRDMRGLSAFDQTHAALARVAYEIPGRGLASKWNISAVALAKTGTPFTVTSGSDAPGYGNVDANGGDRPHLVDPAVLGRTVGDPSTSKGLLPRAAFRFISPAEERGNLGRNTFRKGGIANVNAALWRAWTLRGEVRLMFRGESINLLNTPQFAEPGFELSHPNFGEITNTLNDGRTFRFELQLQW